MIWEKRSKSCPQARSGSGIHLCSIKIPKNFRPADSFTRWIIPARKQTLIRWTQWDRILRIRRHGGQALSQSPGKTRKQQTGSLMHYDLYVGIDYSGARYPESPLSSLQVFAARPSEPEAGGVRPPKRYRGRSANWSRRAIAH